MLTRGRDDVLAKIAADTMAAVSERHRRGTGGEAVAKSLARGAGWSASDVVCTSGPRDKVFEERHSLPSVSVVLSGTFQYRSTTGRHVMTPGSLLLGSPGECFECDHDHAVGDRCVAFHYSPEFLERIASGLSGVDGRFRAQRLPPVRELSDVATRTAIALADPDNASWEELAIRVAAAALECNPVRRSTRLAPSASVMRRVTEQVRAIEADPSAYLTLAELSALVGQSPFTYLRTFEQLTGTTPHQFVLRGRLRRAAARLATEDAKVIDVALSSGFGDVSNFNRTFRAEFGVSPTAYRGRTARAAR